MPKIDPNLYVYQQEAKRQPSTELGKDEFLKILITQLQHQDQLNPMDDRDFISQMATFSSLEQMMQMSNSIDTLVNNQLMSPVVQYSHMIVKEVTYDEYDEQTGQIKDEVTSIVIAVTQEDGWAILKLENGEEVYADAIKQINQPNISEENDQDDE